MASRAGLVVVLLQQALAEGARVDADADRDPLVAAGGHHRTHAILGADVAGVDAHAVDPELEHAQGDAIVVVDVRDERHAHLAADLAEGFRSLEGRRGDAHDVRAGVLERTDLPDRRRDVGGLRVRHALHCDRCVTAHRHVADHDLASLSAPDRGFEFHRQLPVLQRPSVRDATSLRVKGRRATRDPL